MSTAAPVIEQRAQLQDPVPADACAACPHPQADHDPVGLRYCRATVTAGLDRGCIC